MALLLQLEALPLAEEYHGVEEHRWPGASSRQLEDPDGSPGIQSDFIGQRIYFRNGNVPCPRGSQPVLKELECIEGADETVDVQGICDSTSLSECLQRRNESLLPEGCFTMELFGTTSLVFNPGGSVTSCEAPTFCDIICVKLPPGLVTTLPATSTTSTSVMSQSWTFTRSMTSSTLTQTSTATTTSHTSSDTKSLSTTSSTRSSITRTITTTQTSSTSSTFSDTSSTSAMEMLHNNSNFTFNESQTSTTEFVLRSLIDSEESDASPDSDESDPADESDAMSMRDNSKADTSKGSPSLSRGLTAVGNSDFTNGFASPASLVNFVNLRGAIAELRG